MANAVTKQDVKEIVEMTVGKAVEDLSASFNRLYFKIDAHFKSIHTTMHQIEVKLDRIQESLDNFIDRHPDFPLKKQAFL